MDQVRTGRGGRGENAWGSVRSGVDWDDLRFFLMVARRGTLSAAARDLAVTQPTVGRRIAALERRLGAKLFARRSARRAVASDLVDGLRAQQSALAPAG